MTRIEEIEKEMTDIWASCQSWASCGDGSDGACRAGKGYYKLRDELDKLKLEEVTQCKISDL
jgi:hypothetical protein